MNITIKNAGTPTKPGFYFYKNMSHDIVLHKVSVCIPPLFNLTAKPISSAYLGVEKIENLNVSSFPGIWSEEIDFRLEFKLNL